MNKFTVFKAKKVITMNPSMPIATHIGVLNGRILTVGSEEDMHLWGDFVLDDRFNQYVLMPGFVEGHGHANEGSIWSYPYVGYQPRFSPDGNLWQGVKSLPAVIDLLKNIEQQMPDATSPLYAWGFDPIYFDNRMQLVDIDQISTERPVIIMHSNGHLINVNSKILQLAGISKDTQVQGVLKDHHGNPTGELMEMAMIYMAYKQVGGQGPFLDTLNTAHLFKYAQAATNAGVTTTTDLLAIFNDSTLAAYEESAVADNFSIRLLPALNTMSMPVSDGIEMLNNLKQRQKKNPLNKLYYGLGKIMTDGSIQGFTARLSWPGYHNGAPNGLWNMPPQQLIELVKSYHQADLQLHIHVNGDEAIELMIQAIAEAQRVATKFNHRHTLQHCQMASTAQFRKMKKLGICTNLFANHIYYWGDQHYQITLGPDRANNMDACRTALDSGVPLAIHSDVPVTPLAPLFTAWCAVNRKTQTGRILGKNQRIKVSEALYAITMGAAYTLQMDHLVGSIEVGKFADFAVLQDDPTAVSANQLKDIKIWGTVLGGVPFASVLA